MYLPEFQSRQDLKNDQLCKNYEVDTSNLRQVGPESALFFTGISNFEWLVCVASSLRGGCGGNGRKSPMSVGGVGFVCQFEVEGWVGGRVDGGMGGGRVVE